MKSCLVSLALIGVTLGVLPAGAAAQSQTLRCTSTDAAERSYCAADTSGGVRLTRQLSQAPCTQDESWGYDASGVWVSRGCDADFEVLSATPVTPQGSAAASLRCESEDNGRRHCAADTRGGVRLTRQLGAAPCREGVTWGTDASGVWVDQGCRAEFAILSGPAAEPVVPAAGYPSAAHTLRCYSTGAVRHYCAADTRGGVRLNRQLGQVTCREGSTWGYTERGVWVAHGCRGEFTVLPFRAATVSTLRCESMATTGYGRTACPADTRGGVRLVRRLSAAPCTQGRGWGYDAYGVWVDHGCGAEFALGGGAAVAGTTIVPRGTDLAVRNNELIDSKAAVAGQHFSAAVAVDVLDSAGHLVIPRGAAADLVIRSTTGGSITTTSDLVLTLDSVTVRGAKYVLTAGSVERKGAEGLGKNRKTAEIVGGSAVLGSLIGAIAGHGRGAAIGAAVGAAAGAGVEVLTKGQEVRVPAEMELHFKLDQDLQLQAAH